MPEKFESIFIELKIRNKKWLVFKGYNPKTEYIRTYLDQVGQSLNLLIKKFENIIMLGDFNAQITNINIKDFCDTYGLKHLITKPTCFKNAQNPTCIDLIMANSPKSFQNSLCIETGISDYHKPIVTVLKEIIENLHVYKDKLIIELENSGTAKEDYEEFKRIFMNTLDKHAPIKEKR